MEMSTDLMILMVAAVVGAVALTVYFVLCQKRKKIVARTSEKLKRLAELNEKYNFHTKIQKNFQYSHRTSSKAQLEKFQVVQLLNNAILHDQDFINAINAISENRKMFTDYIDEVELIRADKTPEYFVRSLHVNYDAYKKTEEALINKRKLKPILDVSISCYATYTSPKGKNSYQKSATYKTDDILSQKELLRKNMEYEASEWRRKQLARSKMTDKLRYRVLKRDGFRCKICGRSAEDGVKLHVDHIIPVSKGGETTMDNLRTLCEQCNLGKSDEIE